MGLGVNNSAHDLISNTGRLKIFPTTFMLRVSFSPSPEQDCPQYWIFRFWPPWEVFPGSISGYYFRVLFFRFFAYRAKLNGNGKTKQSEPHFRYTTIILRRNFFRRLVFEITSWVDFSARTMIISSRNFIRRGSYSIFSRGPTFCPEPDFRYTRILASIKFTSMHKKPPIDSSMLWATRSNLIVHAGECYWC